MDFNSNAYGQNLSVSILCKLARSMQNEERLSERILVYLAFFYPVLP